MTRHVRCLPRQFQILELVLPIQVHCANVFMIAVRALFQNDMHYE